MAGFFLGFRYQGKNGKHFSLSHEEKWTKPLVDLVVFSENRPLHLFAFLESLQKHATGFYHVSVLYRANPSFEKGYEKVKDAFVGIDFIKEEKKTFKKELLTALEENPSEYFLFAADDLIVKETIDLQECTKKMEELGAYGFYLRLGKHVKYSSEFGSLQEVPLDQSLDENLFAFTFSKSDGDFAIPHTMDMTLYRKKDLFKPLSKASYENPESLAYAFSEIEPKGALGLFYASSKAVHIPFGKARLASETAYRSFSEEEFLQKFEEGFRVDITPYFQKEDRSIYSEVPVELKKD